MKTFARLIRRYVLATAGIILVVVALLLGMTIYAGVRYNGASDSVQKVGALAEALHPPPTACNGTPPTPRPSGCTAMPGPWCWTRTATLSGSKTCPRH